MTQLHRRGIDRPKRCWKTVLERYVLMVLYFSTSGPRWNTQFWNSSDSVCTWNKDYTSVADIAPRGLECDDGILTELELFKNNLVRTIPWELSLLSNLTHIWFHENSLSGSIPSQMSYLSRLESFDASFNSLSGTLPLTFSASITSLRLNRNLLSGMIPSSWGMSMPSVTNLDLRDNTLNGTTPTTFGELTSLETLMLSGNTLTGTVPTELGRIPSLSSLAFYDNMITGSVSETLCTGSLQSIEADCKVECSCCNGCHNHQ